MYFASVLLLFACVFLGGGTVSGYLSDVLLQFLSVPLMLIAVWGWLDCGKPVRLTLDVILVGGMVICGAVIALSQLVPLFSSVGFSGVLERIAASRGIVPLHNVQTGSSSLDPAMSSGALAAVLPTLAMFFLVSLLGYKQRIYFIGWLVFLGMISLMLGILQVMQGVDSPLRFFEISNRSEAIGFFANRNHFAAQLYVTLVFGIIWFATIAEGGLSSRPSSRHMLWFAALFSFLLLVLAGIALARSRAGILLAMGGCAAIVIMSPLLVSILSRREKQERSVRRLVFLGVAILLLGIGHLGAERFLHRFDSGITDSARTQFRNVTTNAAIEALPSGTGLATFPSVYAVYEGEGNLSTFFVNRAHNDWVEFMLEAGLPGGVLITLFLTWFGWRVFQVWFQTRGEVVSEIVLQQGASLVVFLLLLHSFVDYPLRTATMFAYFAAGCALMSPPRRNEAVHIVEKII